MTNTTITLARRTAFAAAIIAAAVLGLRLWLAAQQFDGFLAGAAYLSQFFTILTNALVMLGAASIAFGLRKPDKPFAMVVVAITGVAVLYHTLLAHLWDPQGLVGVADQGVHTVVPLIALVWWFAFAPSNLVRWRDIPLAVVWPLVYCAYALVRAKFSGFYPYPFLNLTELGWPALLTNIAGLTVAFAVLAVLVFGLQKLVIKLVPAK